MLSSVLAATKLLAQAGITVGALALLGIYAYQLLLIYPASLNEGHGHCLTPDEYGMPYEAVALRTADGETLQCYSLKHDRTAPHYSNRTVLVLLPNAGNIGHALPLVRIFYEQLGCNVFIYLYRGYGKLTGTALEAGLKLDAQCVMAHLANDEQLRQLHLVLYGRLLGGAVAIYIAATMPAAVHGVILENTFLLIRKTVPHIFPFLRYVTRFVHQRWDLEALMPLVPPRVPLLMLSATRDEIVPPLHMDQLYALLRSAEKAMHKFDLMHNDTVAQPGYWAIVLDFLAHKVAPLAC